MHARGGRTCGIQRYCTPGCSFLVLLVISSSFGGAEGMSLAGRVTPGGNMNLPLPIPFMS
jgi:hypothetical protein